MLMKCRHFCSFKVAGVKKYIDNRKYRCLRKGLSNRMVCVHSWSLKVNIWNAVQTSAFSFSYCYRLQYQPLPIIIIFFSQN